nr:unnamed protein product [Naegleria fowleri]
MFTEGNNDHSSPPTYRLPNTTPNLQVRSHRAYTVNEDGEEQDPIFTNTNYSSTQVPPLLMNYPSSSFSATTLSHNNNNLDSHTFDHFTPIPMDLNTSSSTMGGTIHRKFESTSNNGDADDTKHKYAFRKKRSNSIASAVFGTCCGSTKRILVTFMILLSIVMVFYIVIYKRKLSLQQARIANAMNNPSSQQPTVQTGSNIMGTKVEKKSQDASQLGDDSVKNKSTKKKNRSGDEEEVDLDELLVIKKKTKKISSSDHVKKSKPSSKNKLSQKKKKLSKKPVINIPHKRRVVKQPKKPFKKPLNPEVKKEEEQEKIIKQAQEKAIDLSAPKSKHDDIIEKYLKMIDEEDISNEKKKKNTKAMNASKDPSSTTSTPPLIKQVAPVNNKKKNKDQNDIEQLKNHPLFKQDPQPFIPKIVEDFNQPIKKESKSNSNKQESVNQEEKPTQNVATTTTTSTTENNDNTRATTSSATTVSTTLSSPDASTTTGTTTTTTTQKEETTSQGDDSKKDKSKSEQVAPEKVEHDKFHDDNLVQVKDNKDSKQQQQQAEKKSQEASPVTKKKKKQQTISSISPSPVPEITSTSSTSDHTKTIDYEAIFGDILSKITDSEEGYGSELGSNSTLHLKIYDDDGDDSVEEEFPKHQLFLEREWNHLAYVYSGDRLREYINGVLTEDKKCDFAILGCGLNKLQVGASNDDYRFTGFKGCLDEIIITNYAMSKREISKLYRYKDQ